jgi:hypothetical protein
VSDDVISEHTGNVRYQVKRNGHSADICSCSNGSDLYFRERPIVALPANKNGDPKVAAVEQEASVDVG